LSRAEKNIIWFSFFPRSLWALQIGFFLIDPQPMSACQLSESAVSFIIVINCVPTSSFRLVHSVFCE
jgi:hypothetical protein